MLVLFSGMGADESIFVAQKREFPDMIVMPWETPLAGESLAEYGERLGRLLDVNAPCFIGGASFGGIVALEVTKHIDCRGCFLIGSLRSPKQLPLRIRIWQPLRKLIRFFPMRFLQLFSTMLIPVCRTFGWRHSAVILRQFSKADIRVLKWSMIQILSWGGTATVAPVFHIHGARDYVLPLKYVTPDKVLPDGGHVISFTHGSIVNDFLRKHMHELSDSKQLDRSETTET